jgi:hypothetical protein
VAGSRAANSLWDIAELGNVVTGVSSGWCSRLLAMFTATSASCLDSIRLVESARLAWHLHSIHADL